MDLEESTISHKLRLLWETRKEAAFLEVMRDCFPNGDGFFKTWCYGEKEGLLDVSMGTWTVVKDMSSRVLIQSVAFL